MLLFWIQVAFPKNPVLANKYKGTTGSILEDSDVVISLSKI